MRFNQISQYLLHSDALLKIGMSPTYHFYQMRENGNHIIIEDDENGSTIAIARNAHMTLDPVVVRNAFSLLSCGGAELDERLRDIGVCVIDPPSGEVVLDTKQFHNHLVDVAFVFVGNRAKEWHVWPEIICTCLLFALHAECPHCLFAKSLNLQSRQADVNLSDYPTRQSVGDSFRRDRKPTENAAAMRAAAKKKARSETRNRLLSEFFPVAVTSTDVGAAVVARPSQKSLTSANIKCAAGHALEKKRFGHGPKVCDLCNIELSAKCWRWTCEQCDYDVCKSCMA